MAYWLQRKWPFFYCRIASPYEGNRSVTNRPGVRFSKLPVTTGPRQLSCFHLRLSSKCYNDFNSFVDNMLPQSVYKTKLTFFIYFLTSTLAFILQILILIFGIGLVSRKSR